MLRILNEKLSGVSSIKRILLIFCLVLTLSVTIGTTFSYIITKTPTLINLFVNGLDPERDLIIQKEVKHPFGDNYVIPEDLEFTFEVVLGADYANKEFKTTQGTKTADENGIITMIVLAGGRSAIYDLDEEIAVKVKEIEIGKGFSPDLESKEIMIKNHRENIVTFTNTYLPEKADTSALTVTGVKNLAGRDWQVGDSFTFELEVFENNEWKSLGTKTTVYESEEQLDYNKFDFSDLIQSYVFEEAGTYSFRITEVAGTIGGIVYDEPESRFSVYVGDADMDGSLEIQSVDTSSANTTVDGARVDIIFVNEYAPEGSAEVEIRITKALEDTSGQNKLPAGFKFELYNDQGEVEKISEATDSAGNTTIRLVYEPTEAGKIYVYTLKEYHGGETIEGVFYDNSEYRIQVAVVDNLDGTVSAHISEYQEPAISAEVEEVLEEKETVESEEVVEEEIPTEPEEIGEEETPTEPEEIGEEETPTEPEKIIEEETPVEPEEIETDSEDSQELSEPIVRDVELVSSSGKETYTVTFTNRYDPEDCTVDLAGTKVLNGRALKAGEFTFQLYETNGLFELPDDLQPIGTAVNDAEGEFCFEGLEFDQVGTYYYVVTEDSSKAVRGITYDESKYLVTIVVTDNGGVLSADKSITDTNGVSGDIKFENSYKAFSVTLPLSGKKVLVGRELKSGEFYFQLFAANEQYIAQGNPLQTVKNDENGAFQFKDLKFEKEGLYHYVIKEDSSAQEKNMEYDDTVYGISVTVSDPGNGQFAIDNVSITSNGMTVKEILFKNIYTGPDEPEEPITPDEPDNDKPEDTAKENVTQDKPAPTADAQQVMLYIILAVFGLVAAISLGVVRYRKKLR